MTKLKSSNTIAKLKNIVMSLLILIFVLFISIPPSLAAILPTDSAPHTSNIAVDSNLADTLPSVPTSTSTEPEPEPELELEPELEFNPENNPELFNPQLRRCKFGCRYDSSDGKCKPTIPTVQCY
jgi:hypothetical protein